MEQALIGGGMDDPEAVPDVLARAERYFERARRGEVRDGRMLAALAAVAAYTARSAVQAGDLDIAEEFSERALELGRELGAELYGTMFLALILIERGRIDDAAAMVESMSLPDTGTNGATMVAIRGLVWIAAGAHQSGLADLLDAEGRNRTAGLRLSVGTSWVRSAAAALVSLGHRAQAVEIARRELAEASSFGAPHMVGVALSVCGSLESGPAGLARLREAASILERSEARLDHALALVNLGVGLRDRGEREPARRELSRALDIASRCGAITLAERARSEMTVAGARPRREQLTGPGSLTPAELRAARMAADGLSNREIAQALLVSAKTIETQLSAAYAMLSITSRHELRGALAKVATAR